MSLTPEDIARAVLRDTHLRGTHLAYQLRREITSWLMSTSWFMKKYLPLEQGALINEVEQIIRTKWSKKAQETRRKDKERKRVQALRDAQMTFDF